MPRVRRYDVPRGSAGRRGTASRCVARPTTPSTSRVRPRQPPGASRIRQGHRRLLRDAARAKALLKRGTLPRGVRRRVSQRAHRGETPTPPRTSQSANPPPPPASPSPSPSPSPSQRRRRRPMRVAERSRTPPSSPRASVASPRTNASPRRPSLCRYPPPSPAETRPPPRWWLIPDAARGWLEQVRRSPSARDATRRGTPRSTPPPPPRDDVQTSFEGGRRHVREIGLGSDHGLRESPSPPRRATFAMAGSSRRDVRLRAEGGNFAASSRRTASPWWCPGRTTCANCATNCAGRLAWPVLDVAAGNRNEAAAMRAVGFMLGPRRRWRASCAPRRRRR